MYESIVVGTDFSPTAEEAVRQAVQLAKAFGAQLHVVTAFTPGLSANIAASSLEAMAVGGAQFIQEAHDAMADEIQTTHQSIVDRLGKDGIAVRCHSCADDPSDALLDVAADEKADLIVIGNRGMSGAKRFVLGSVPNKISHHAPCSVLIVHTS